MPAQQLNTAEQDASIVRAGQTELSSSAKLRPQEFLRLLQSDTDNHLAGLHGSD